MKKIFILPIIVATIIIGSCDKNEATINKNCIKAKFIGTYCEGIVIQIIDGADIGIDWNGMYDGKSYTNSVVASVDSLLAKSIEVPEIYFSVDSVFYFKYNNGGYPRNHYNLCEPSAFITISYISKNRCEQDASE